MRIAALTGPQEFELQEVPTPEVGPDEVLLQVAGSGVCTSDLDAWRGQGEAAYPRYLGHEVSGRVVAAGTDVVGVGPGDAVGAWVTSHGFADYVAVKAQYTRPAAGVRLDTALAEPLSCAVNAVERADVRLADDVVLIGAGFMGNLVQQLVALRGPRRLVVADARADALARAELMGATRVVDVTRESLTEVVADLTDGRGADITFECTGSQGALDTMGDVTRMSGKLVFVGFHQGAPRPVPLGYWNWMAFELVNGHFRDVGQIMHGMTIGLRLLQAGSVSLDRLVTHRFPLDDIGAAFRAAEGKPEGFAKAVITFPG